MMSKNEVYTYCAAILTTLHDVSIPVPASQFYMLLGMNMEKWETIRDILIKSHMIAIKHHLVSLTPDGIKIAMELNAKLN